MIHTLPIHNEHHQINGLAAKLQAPAAAGEGYRRWRTPTIEAAIRRTTGRHAFAVPAAKADGDINHGWNEDNALRVAQNLGWDSLVGCSHDFLQNTRRIIQTLGNFRFCLRIRFPELRGFRRLIRVGACILRAGIGSGLIGLGVLC